LVGGGLVWSGSLGGQRERAAWILTLYPEAGEAGGRVGTLAGRVSGGGRAELDPERSEVEAARRAKGKIRRYCAANRLNRFVTLTYAGSGCFEPLALRRDLGGFFRQLREELGGKPIPYLWVPEWHPGGHGLHVHFAVGRYIKKTLIRDAWGRGHTKIKLIGDLPVGSGALEEARIAGRYLAKYVGKAIGDARVPGLHRYEVAQGFQPQSVECYGRTAEEAIANASALMGRAPVHVWKSGEGWDGPPACWAAWN
jgi:hypothetical protein